MTFPLEETTYGFTWGPVTIERLISDRKWGVILSLKSKGNDIEIRVTPGGQVKIHKWRAR